MVKYRNQFICQNCGSIYSRWSGKCDACGEWNTITEDSTIKDIHYHLNQKSKKGTPVSLIMLSDTIEEQPRIETEICELDRVIGGGFVKGSVILVGGDPGIGKSTLLMQAAAALARNDYRVIYVSGEEAAGQIRLRAQRLGANDSNVALAVETNVENILATLSEGQRPDLVIIDSIQTLWSETAQSVPGTVMQVRTSVQVMIQYAKKNNVSIVLVGHVTKEGQIAGPRVIEHMVDAVLYFEGNTQYNYRILRSIKNRFGATDEIGVFEMSDTGLKEIENPSQLFLSERNTKAPGTAVFAGREGSRSLLVEIQSLVSPSSFSMPRRTTVGCDSSRLAMILAVLETHCKIKLSTYDVYLNVAGGYRISETAADLAVAAALLSSLFSLALPTDCIYLGEISLSGAVRPIGHTLQRLKEAEKLGFSSSVLPNFSIEEFKVDSIHRSYIDNINSLAKKISNFQPIQKIY
ncbi:DNA repair protein RadA [Liberibacter crescens BT-1]|uniref:DNA repair protein RadA n=1 Tax=Liberibacter crescens (strain BT-1) TaxID=1215343 RepID=L0EUG1_LIBCB|nr:DNA repair protein RadA [Liberibacter crescens]AGA64308.1 DNA repair protein RadA [Liberibacter crescens BT-1]AMC12521.1 DNA repair protein RadA [Liberibacter crescens]